MNNLDTYILKASSACSCGLPKYKTFMHFRKSSLST
jgi:hypothetical protein